MQQRTGDRDKHTRRQRAHARGQQHIAHCADADHDHHDFHAFQHDGLVRGQHRHCIPSRGRVVRRSQRARLLRIDRALVMVRDDACGAQNGFAQPADSEQQQRRAHDDLQVGDRNRRDRGAE